MDGERFRADLPHVGDYCLRLRAPETNPGVAFLACHFVGAPVV